MFCCAICHKFYFGWKHFHIARHYRPVLEENAMKINMFKFYKISCICLLSLGLCVILGSIILTICNYQGIGIDDFIMLFLAVPLGIVISLFPVLINYKQLTHISLDHEKCISYSLLGKRLCEINYHTTVFYSFFEVKFLYAPPVRFIAISNMPFKCEQNPKSIFDKKFYGCYDQSRIIIFPYDDKVALFLNLDDWQKIN